MRGRWQVSGLRGVRNRIPLSVGQMTYMKIEMSSLPLKQSKALLIKFSFFLFFLQPGENEQTMFLWSARPAADITKVVCNVCHEVKFGKIGWKVKFYTGVKQTTLHQSYGKHFFF